MALEHEEWKGTTGGLPWMQRTMIKWLSVIDQRVIYVALVMIFVPFYMLTCNREYRAMYHFYHRVRREPWWKSFAHVFVNQYHFGQVIVDRFAAFGGREFKFEMDDREWAVYCGMANADDGFLQLSCHMGNYELAGYILRQPKKTMHALVFMGETETMMQNRAKLFAPRGVEMVPVMPDMSHIFALNNALRDGNVASMPGDRIFGSTKAVECRMLGHRVQLPQGPFQLAVTREVRLMAVWVMKASHDTYRVHCHELKANPELKKSERVADLARQFAAHMEQMIEQYPTHWFNYFEFFEQ
ncbi:MAG: acyltransferase [Bacteroidales bacterium]|nr:acyltransferase [Candidatus Liminaster caballi]